MGRLDRKANFFRAGLRRYTMTLSIGKLTTAHPAYIIFTGKEPKNDDEESAAAKIGSSLLLSEILSSILDTQNGRLNLDNHIIMSLDHAFIVTYLINYTDNAPDRFSIPNEVNTNFENIDQSRILIIFHRPDLKKVRFFLAGGEECVVSYHSQILEQRKPLFSLMEKWENEHKRYIEYGS